MEAASEPVPVYPAPGSAPWEDPFRGAARSREEWQWRQDRSGRLLRLAAGSGRSPFPLGVTTSLPGLVSKLEATGLEVAYTDYLIHNPRIVSTLAFLTLRKIFVRWATRPIRWLLRAFAALDRLPTRGLTSCFVAVCARKPAAG